MKLLVARHGKSNKKVNAKGFPQILGGSYQYDKGLVSEGVAQAEELGRVLMDIEINAAYSSDLLRAKQTSETAVRVYGGNLQYVIADERLNERHFRALSGEFCNVAVFREDVVACLDQERIEDYLGVPNTFASFRHYLRHMLYERNAPNIEATNIITINSAFPHLGVEPMKEIVKRLDDFERFLIGKHHPDSTLAVFSHGDVVRCWLGKIENNPHKYSLETVRKVKRLPHKGWYREVPNCGLFEIVLR